MLNETQIKRLLDIANAGCHKGMVAEARTVYSGILAVQPDHAPALIGQALSHIVVGEYETAETVLRDTVLAKSPDDADALAILGLCLFLADRKDEARDILEGVKGTEGTAAELAASLLEQLD